MLMHREGSSAAVQRRGRDSHTLRMVRELCAASALRRLRDVAFLGAIDYCATFRQPALPYNRSRLAHSQSVALLAHTFAEVRGLPGSSRRCLVAAGLLHDLGHPPLSHSAEVAFVRRYRVDHATATRKLIRGQWRAGRQIPRILARYGVDAETVIAVIDGDATACMGAEAFAAPINVDTLDGITRAARYFGRPAPSRATVVGGLAAIVEGRYEAMDAFWNLKRDIYARDLSSPLCSLLDATTVDYLEHTTLKPTDGLLTDSALFDRHPRLSRMLGLVDIAVPHAGLGGAAELTRPRKRYCVDRAARPRTAAELSLRYKRESALASV